jgi:flagellar biogenesis protein FliO
MNKGNQQIMAILVALRKLPRWALILITVGVIVILGVAMFLLLPQNVNSVNSSQKIESPASLAFSVFLKMGVVVILLIGLAIILRRWQTKTQITNIKQINVLETIHLSPHRTLYMINVDDQKILIGATDQSMTNLYQQSATRSLGEIQAKSDNDFAEVLAQTQLTSDQEKNN